MFSYILLFILLENSFLKEKKIFVDETLSAQEVQDRIKELPMLIFELTEKCNLQCKYCIYGLYVLAE